MRLNRPLTKERLSKSLDETLAALDKCRQELDAARALKTTGAWLTFHALLENQHDQLSRALRKGLYTETGDDLTHGLRFALTVLENVMTWDVQLADAYEELLVLSQTYTSEIDASNRALDELGLMGGFPQA